MGDVRSFEHCNNIGAANSGLYTYLDILLEDGNSIHVDIANKFVTLVDHHHHVWWMAMVWEHMTMTVTVMVRVRVRVRMEAVEEQVQVHEVLVQAPPPSP